MCRLYGMHASHPTKIECDLVRSQNSLIRQSEEDRRGLANPDGWGIGLVTEHEILCTRDVDPAFEDLEDYRRATHTVRPLAAIAHVRLATVGKPSYENTHPFRWENSLLAHNGHIPDFDAVRPLLLEELEEEQRAAIRGETDSEHFFRLLLSQMSRMDGTSRLDGDEAAESEKMLEVLRRSAEQVRGWIDEAGGGEERELGLNVLWTIGREFVGSRLCASLYRIEREAPLECDLCGERHAEPPSSEGYRQVVVASERLTGEDWTEVPESSVFRIDPAIGFEIGPLFD